MRSRCFPKDRSYSHMLMPGKFYIFSVREKGDLYRIWQGKPATKRSWNEAGKDR